MLNGSTDTDNPSTDSPKTILYLCGDEGILRVRQLLLEHSGYRVWPTSSVSDAQAIAETTCPDMFLMDSNYPDYDSERIAAEIKSICPALTVVVLTQSFSARRNFGCVASYVARDEGPSVLLDEISRLLSPVPAQDVLGTDSMSA